MPPQLASAAKWLLGPEVPAEGRSGHLWARWMFLRALALIYFSAFYSLLFQIKGLLGPNGLLPATDYLQAIASAFHGTRVWYAPSLFWCGAGDRALMLVCWIGVSASLLAFLNIFPRLTLALSFVCFLSFTAVAQDFAGYQSDGMLLEAGFVALFFAPSGLRPGLGRAHPASRASLYLLRGEWFRVYFESGVSKMTAGDPSWHNFTAMDQYYQNGPLPTWIGWYLQHLPHWFHAGTAALTLVVELAVVWMVFLPRRFRMACFCIVTPFEIAIILTANYGFLNYIVLSLGFLLLDDRFIEWAFPRRLRGFVDRPTRRAPPSRSRVAWRRLLVPSEMTVAGVCFALVFYVTTAKLLEELFPSISLPQGAVNLIEPFRIAQDYHLFGTMTPNRMEVEFEGTLDGKTWTPYQFRYKPQDLHKAPGIYAPYQPRFEWNLWFASLGGWQEYRWVLWTEERLLKNEPDVLALFAGNPFPGGPPLRVRSVIYQYWFTDMQSKRTTGLWWRRELLGDYAPQLEREPDGNIEMLQVPSNFRDPSPPATPSP
jgi:hypothetical protein